MILKDLKLQDFRSYQQKNLQFSSQTTLLVGPNAVGKTNILEAIVLLATGKSFIAEKEAEMIRNGAEIGRVEGEIGDSDSEKKENLRLSVVLTKGWLQGEKVSKKRLLVNGVAKRLMDFAGNLRVVLFQPEDLNLVLGSPSKRRDYLDFVLTQVDREYYRCLLAYQNGLRRRNRLLMKIREGEASRTQLDFWDRLLIKNGQMIHLKRREFLSFINRQCQAAAISQWQSLEVEYDDSLISHERLQKYAEAEVAAAATLVGPHRDDIRILNIKNKISKIGETRDLAIYGSRGEQRMAVLALKLAELAFIVAKTGEQPLLLLDDIFSELDHEHREQVLSIIDRQQTIITTTDIHLVELRFRNKMEIIPL